MPLRLATIVEGDGEVEAVPVLVRAWFPTAVTLRPIRAARDRFLTNPAERRRYLRLARAQGCDRLLVLMDAHEDCPAALGAGLRRSIAEEFDRPFGIVLAVQEYETWFLQCLTPFVDRIDPAAAERLRGAKERVAEIRGRYTPTADQASLSAELAATWATLPANRVPRSLAKLRRELERLLGHPTDPTLPVRP